MKTSAVREDGAHEPYGADQGVYDRRSTLVRRKQRGHLVVDQRVVSDGPNSFTFTSSLEQI